MSMNNCNYNSCYGPFRTEFDRMMQRKHGNGMCQPSAKLVCDGSGNAVLESDAQDKRQAAFEAFRMSRAHRARQIALSRAKAQARRRAPVRRRGRENFEGPPSNGNGKKKKAKLGLADWCGFCAKLKQELPKVKELLHQQGIELEIIEDKADLDKMMKENKQNGFPFAVLVDEDGVVVDSFSGFMPAEKYAARVKKGHGV